MISTTSSPLVPILVSEKITHIILFSWKSHWKNTLFSYPTIYLFFFIGGRLQNLIVESLPFIRPHHICGVPLPQKLVTKTYNFPRL